VGEAEFARFVAVNDLFEHRQEGDYVDFVRFQADQPSLDSSD
jgi:hypothetical protein